MIEYHDVQPSTHTYVTITSTTPMLPLAYLKQNMIFDHAIFAYTQIIRYYAISSLIQYQTLPAHNFVLPTSVLCGRSIVNQYHIFPMQSYDLDLKLQTNKFWGPANQFQQDHVPYLYILLKMFGYSLYLSVKLPTYTFGFIWYKSTTKMYISVAC